VSAEYLAGIEANRQDGETRGNEESAANQLDLGFSTVD